MKTHLKYFLYLCIVSNFITSNSNETFSQPKAHESSLCGKVANHEPRALIFKDMIKICVEADGVFYETLNLGGKELGIQPKTLKRRCLSDNFPDYKIVPYRTIYTEKACTQCGKTKLLKEFYKDQRGKDGLSSCCKECILKNVKKYRDENPEKIKTQKKKSYQDNPEKYDKRNKEWRRKNPEKVKESQDEWNKNNLEKVRKNKREWKKRQKDNGRMPRA